mgnify:CR=1 FL=1
MTAIPAPSNRVALGALRALVETAEAARRLGMDLWADPRLRSTFTLPARYLMPDGTLPRFGDSVDTRLDAPGTRSLMELACRAIPGSHQYVAVAAPHHGQSYGSLILIDPRVADDDAMAPVRRFTPEVAFPESQGGREVYGTPRPLSEDYVL